MNTKKRLILIIVIFILSLGIIVPVSWKQSAATALKVQNWGPVQWYTNKKLNLGLDLQGGTQLDFKIDLREVAQKDQQQVIDGVKTVFERRVNSLGVSEPNIYVSTFGDEKHIVIELAGIKDVNEAKKTIGKVIQLEFKEQNDAQESDLKAKIQTEAKATLEQVKQNPDKIEQIGNEVTKSGSIGYEKKDGYLDEFPLSMQEKLKTLKEGELLPDLAEGSTDASYAMVNGEIKQVPAKTGLYIVKLVKKETVLRSEPKNAEDFTKVAAEVSSDKQTDLDYVRKQQLPTEVQEKVFGLTAGSVSDVLDTANGYEVYKMATKEVGDKEMVRAQHILIAFKSEDAPVTLEGSQTPDPSTSSGAVIKAYNETEVPKKAAEILKQVQAKPDNFGLLAKVFSEDPGSKEKDGDLGYFVQGAMVAEFDKAVFSLQPGQVSDLIKTQYGYHIIRVMDKKLANEQVAKLERIRICYTGINGCTSGLSKEAAKAKADAAMKRVREETKYSTEQIFYSTAADPYKPAMAKNAKGELEALNGKFFKRADVQYSQQTLEPIVAIQFNDEGAKMFEELTEKLKGKQMAIFVGGDLISAPRINEKIPGGTAIISGQFTLQQANQLATDLNAGSIPAPITLVGEQEIGAQLGAEALKRSVEAGIIGIIVLMLFLIFYYRLPGLIASIALGAYITVMIATIEVFGVVLTLAGIAGVILSIGMAVDANVLIFERLKEELGSGKTLHQTIKISFDRAWTSIRDSNTSSLFTAAILFWFGTSLIRGFATMLIIGVLLSLFSAIYITRTLLEIILQKVDTTKHSWWGGRSKNDTLQQ